MSISKSYSSRLFGFIHYALLIAFAMCVLYPVYYTIMVSVSTYKDIASSLFLIIPEKIDFRSYMKIFADTSIDRGFLISMFITVAGTVINMLVTVSAAWALSRKDFPGRKLFLGLIIFTMLFDGGLIPYYLTIKRLGLIDSLLVMILPVAVDTFFLFIMISYFKTVPPSLEESAKLDGANDIIVLFRIIIPVAMPTIAAIALFYSVARWNEWWHGMLFLIDHDKDPVMLILRNMLVSIEQVLTSGSAGAGMAGQSKNMFTPGLKMASVVITTIPIMMVYPFLQKYFTKGIMIGSIKG